MEKSKKKVKKSKKSSEAAVELARETTVTTKKQLPIWKQASFHKIALFVFALLLYVNTFNHKYAQDDAIVIYANMFTQQGISGFPGILSNDTFFGFFKEEGKAKLVAGGRYRPFTQLMFALEWQIFGDNPRVGHTVNMLLYGLLGLMLYNFLSLLVLGQNKSGAKETDTQKYDGTYHKRPHVFKTIDQRFSFE